MRALTLLVTCSGLLAQDAIDLGSRRELFVDHYLIEKLDGAALRLHAPRFEGKVLDLEKPWEGPFSGYFTVLKDGGKFLLYYRGLRSAGQDGRETESTCLAESDDGIRWVKPALGLFELAGTKENNAVLAKDPPFSHNFTPMIDTRPGVPAGERFKALAGTSRTGLMAFVSADGRRWRRMRDEPVLPPAKETRYDSQNLAFWSESEGRYLCYFRIFKPVDVGGRVQRYRWVSRATSTDFRTWSEPVDMTFGDAPPEHLYTNQTSPYFRAPHLYLSVAARFLPGRQVLSEEQALAVGANPGYFKDCSDAVFFSTRGGNRYDRTFLEGFIRPGLGLENWVSRTNYPALNVVQTSPSELSIYMNRNYTQESAHLVRFSLRLDGFASLHAGYRGGEARTKLLRFRGSELELNFSTSAAGGVRVEIEDASGKVLAASKELIGDEIARAVVWEEPGVLARLAGQPVRLRFKLRDADVFSFRFR